MKLHHIIAATAAALLLAACGPRVKLANAITSTAAQQLVANGPSELRDVRFDDQFTLLGVNGRTTGDGLMLELAWKANGKQKLAYHVPIHVLDAEGKIVGQADYNQDAQQREIAGDTIWRDEVRIPRDTLAGSTSVGIGLLGGAGQWLLADRGPRDNGNRRLLFPVPESLTKPGAPAAFDGFLEVVNDKEIIGWAWEKKQPSKAVAIELFDGDNSLGQVTADIAREGLAKAGIGDGKHAFRFDTPAQLKDGKAHLVAARIAGAEFELQKSPKAYQWKK